METTQNNDQILIQKDFEGSSTTIYGTLEEPLFNVDEMTIMFKIQNAKEKIEDFDDMEICKNGRMFTECGLYKFLAFSKKDVNKRFKKWVISEIRKGRKEQKDKVEATEVAYKLKLQHKEEEILRYKDQIYEEAEKKEHLYLIRTDGGYKIGRTKNTVKTRIKGMQTGNVDDIEIIFDCATCNAFILEKLVHTLLDKYRCRSNREFFKCNVEYMIAVIKMSGALVNTITSSYCNIPLPDLLAKLRENGLDVEKNKEEQDQRRIASSDVMAGVLFNNYERGKLDDYIHMNQIKKVLMSNGVKKRDIVKIKQLLETLFDCQYKEDKRINNERLKRVFVGIKLKAKEV